MLMIVALIKLNQGKQYLSTIERLKHLHCYFPLTVDYK